MTFRIRAGDLRRDRAAARRFILGLQRFEYDIVPNRRLDEKVAEDHLGQLFRDPAKVHGIFVAEDAAGAAQGWAVVIEAADQLYVEESLRRYAYIAELYLEDVMRGTGAGKALLTACEDWARANGFHTLQIGVLAGNARARKVYGDAGFAPYAVELRKRL
jgi:GNAT superfamily N-acetyltransferase